MTMPKVKRRPKAADVKLKTDAKKRKAERHRTIEALRNLILDTRKQLREDITDIC